MKIVEENAAPRQADPRQNCPSPAQMAEGVPEDPDLEHGDNRRAKESDDEKPDDGSLEAQDQSADAHRRHAQAAEMDKGYEEKLEGLAHNLPPALLREAEPVDPAQSTPLLLDGMLLQRFILSSDFDPPQRTMNRLAAILPIGIACVVVAAIAHYFAVGNFIGMPQQPQAKQAQNQAQQTEPQQPQAQRAQPGQQSANENSNQNGSQNTVENPSRGEIRQIQQALEQKGFKVRPVDGKLGPMTKRALSRFQRKQGLQQTGMPDEQTLGALRIGGRASNTGQGPSGSGGINPDQAPSNNPSTQTPGR